MHDTINQFCQAMRAAGITPPDAIEPDGKIHRFPTNDKSGDTSGWFILYGDGIPAGRFGDWRTGLDESWRANGRAYSHEEESLYHQHIAAMRREHAAEEEQRHTQARERAAAIWNVAQLAPEDFPYLKNKRVLPHGLRLHQGQLVVPMRDTDHALSSLQTIDPNGDKRFLPGGRVAGCYFAIGKPEGSAALCIVEGYATGASVHMATGYPVAVAFNAGNLLAVAQAMRARFPDLPIILCADDDFQTAGNPGLAKATEAARAVGGLLAIPNFGASRPDKATDFNDMAALYGLKAVKRMIASASAPKNGALHLDSKKVPADRLEGEGRPESEDTWPLPTPLPDVLPPVQPFDPELLPVALRGWVMDIAHRMQCPPDFPAVGAVVALSSLIGARVVVRPKARDDWQVTPNLWGLIVGRPGVMKSPALKESLKPMERLEATEFEQWQAVHDAWKIETKLAELQSADNEKKAKGLANKDPMAARTLLQSIDLPEEPQARRLIVNDATVEKLGELLQMNTWGILSYRDELYGLLTSMDKQGQEGARTFYLQAYDGDQGYTFDRIMRGTVHIDRVCLAMLGSIQPGRVQEYVRGAVSGGSADDGLLQRFGLAVWPDVNGEFHHVDQLPDTSARQAAWAVFERLAALQPVSDTDPHIWRFDAAAQDLFVEWRVPFEQQLKGGDLHPAVESHLAKYRKLIPALALVFALIDTPDSGGVIGEAELLRALAWGDYLRSHANRLYSAAVIPETLGAASLLKKIMASALGIEFTPRQAALKGWAGLNTPEAVRKAADVLADYDWLRREVQQTGGRPSERYLVNPAALARRVA